MLPNSLGWQFSKGIVGIGCFVMSGPPAGKTQMAESERIHFTYMSGCWLEPWLYML